MLDQIYNCYRKIMVNYGFTCTLILLLCFLIKKYIIEKFQRDPRLMKFAADLPGPPAFPVVGSILEFFWSGMGGVDQILSKYGQKYGKQYKLWFGKHLGVILGSLPEVEDVLKSKKNSIAHPDEILIPAIEFWNFQTTDHSHGDVWKNVRQILMPSVSKNNVNNRFPSINKAIGKFIQQLKRRIDGSEFDISVELRDVSVDFITITLFDVELTEYEKNYFNFFEISRDFGLGATYAKLFMPHLRVKWLRDIIYFKKVTTNKKKIQNLFELLMNRKPEFFDDSQMNKFKLEKEMNYIHLAVLAERKMRLDDFAINELALNIAGPTRSLSLSIAFILTVLALYPDIQDKLHEEISTKLGSEERVTDGNDIQKLQFLDQVIKECGRFFGVGLNPFLYKYLTEDCKIGTSIFPAHIGILIRVADIHFDDSIYENPYEFNPNNFAPEVAAKRSKHAFLTFSQGPRNCMGKYFSEAVIKLTVVELLRIFKFSTTTPKISLYDIFKNSQFSLKIELRNAK